MAKKSIITPIGSAVLDIMYYTNEAVVVNTPQKVTQRKLLGFEFGAKIISQAADFNWGGSALNTAATFREMGLAPTVLSAIGNDAIGKEIVRTLKAQRVPTRLLQIDPKHATAVSFIVNAKQSKDHVAFYYPGARSYLKITHALAAKIRTPWIYLGSLSGSKWEGSVQAVFSHAARKNIRVAWNPGSDELKAGFKKLSKYLSLTDVLLVNLDEATELVVSSGHKVKTPDARKLIKLLHTCGQNISVITNGSSGAYVYDGKKLIYKSALKSSKKVVNTTGAGDAFGSGFVSGLHMYKNNLSRALSLAIHNSGAVVRESGAQNGILTKKSLRKLNI